MENNELQELFCQLEEKGWEPMMCDTEIREYDNNVSCGMLEDSGDATWETGWYPHEMLPPGSVYRVRAKGDSMYDAGIDPGDYLTIETDARISDDDLVLVGIDGDFLVKAYYEDDDDDKWLVPYNERFAPVRLTEEQQPRILGKVIEINKRNPHVRHRDSKLIVRKYKESRRLRRQLSKEELLDIIRQAAPMVEVARQWFAVYNPLAHQKHIEKGNYACFCNLVAEAVPQHAKLPAPVELQRMDVQSFTKPVSLWDEADAPVIGQRFRAYKDIGQWVQNSLKTL